jgi:hypothetical protein
MRRPSVTLLLLLLGACSSTQNQSIERGIRSGYDNLERAFEAQDTPGILAMRAPNFEAFGPQGQHDDYAAMAEYTRRWFTNNKPPIEVHFTIQSIDVRSPDEAAVKVLQRASRYQEIEGHRRKVEHEVTQRETWIRTPAGWRLRMVDQIDLEHRKRWIDGELQKPPS